MTTVSDALRDRVRQSVAVKHPIDSVERECIAEFVRRFDSLAHPFDEHADPVHVTGSAIVAGPRGVILVKHKSLGIWLQPGGHVEPDETPWDAALREANEETGLDVVFAGATPQLVHVDVHAGGRGHTHLDLRYLVEAGDRDPQPPQGESQEIAWFGWPAAVERADDERLKSLLRGLGPV